MSERDDPVGVAMDEAWADGYNHAKVEMLTESRSLDGRLEAVIAWAEDYFGDATMFPSGLVFALWTEPAHVTEARGETDERV